MKECLFVSIIAVCAVIVVLTCIKSNNVQMVGHVGLRQDHLSIISAQADTAHLIDDQHREINRKLDLLLNIATNQVDGVRRLP